ncbi:MAG: CvpA family protein [Candidatus Krumholzibacteriota bacterium]
MNFPLLMALAAIIAFGILGFRDGVVKRILEITGVLVSLILTARFASAVQPWIMDKTGMNEGASLLVTWAVLFFVGLVLSRILATFISKALRLTVLGWLDKWGGALVGLAFGTLVTSVILVAATQVPGGRPIQTAYDKSPLGQFIYYAAPVVYEQARKLSGGQVEEIWDRALDKAKESGGKVKEEVGEAVDEAVNE